MADGRVTIEIDLDEKDVISGIDDVEKRAIKAANNAGDQSVKAAEKSTSSISRLSEQSVNIARKAALGIAAIGGAFGAFSIKAAGDLQAQNAQFSTVYGDLEEQATGSLESIAETTGILPSRLKGTFTQIAAFAKTTGADTAEALSITERATLAAADSAAFYDKSIESTTEALQSYLKGNYENDAALGISSTETTRNAKANELYSKSFIDLDESQKQLTLLAMVEDGNKLSGALGQAARESDGLENVLGNLKQSVTDVASAFGTPILAGFIAGAQTAAGVLGRFAEVLRENPALVYVIIGALTTLAAAFGAVWIAANKAAILSSISSGFALLTNPIFLVVAAIGALITAFVYFYNSSETFRNAVNGIMDAISNSAPIKAFKDAISSINLDSIAKGFDSFRGVISDLVEGFIDMVKPFYSVGEGIDFVGIGFKVLQSAVLALLGPFGIAIKIIQLLAKVIGGGDVQDGIQSMLDGFTSMAEGIRNSSGQVGESVGTMIEGILKAIANALPGIISGGLAIIAGLISGIARGIPKIALAAIELITTFTASILLLIPTVAIAATSIIVAFLGALTGSVATIAMAGTTLIVAFIGAIITNVPRIVTAVTSLIVTFLLALANNLPRIITAGITLLISFLQGITDNLPRVVATVATLITTLLDAVAERLPSIISSGSNLIVKFLEGLAEKLPSVLSAAVDVIIAFLDGIADNLPRIVSSAINLIVKFLQGIAQEIPSIVDAAFDIVDALVDGLLQSQDRLFNAITTLMNGMASNIRESAPEMRSAAGNLLRAIIEAFPGGGLVTAGYDLIMGLAKGIGNAVGGVISKAKEVAGNIIGAVKGAFDINSPSRVMRDEVGKFIPQGIAVGIEADEDAALKSMDKMNQRLMGVVPSPEMAMGSIRKSANMPAYASSNVVNNYGGNATDNETIQLLKQIRDKTSDVVLDGTSMVKKLGTKIDENQGTRTSYAEWGLELNG